MIDVTIRRRPTFGQHGRVSFKNLYVRKLHSKTEIEPLNKENTKQLASSLLGGYLGQIQEAEIKKRRYLCPTERESVKNTDVAEDCCVESWTAIVT